jgi:hypothetical protein
MSNEQTIWLREEISIADELMSYAPKLLSDFLTRHPDFIDGDFALGIPYVFHTDDKTTLENINTKDAWKTDTVKFSNSKENFYMTHLDRPIDVRESYPTAIEMTERYGSDCPISTYSIIEKNSVINRHTGAENRDSEFIRIHIPLLVPEGDIFFEVEGVEIDWSDLFGFDNQIIHSAHNYSNNRRLVYLIDISRKLLGIPNGKPFNPEREKSVPPFQRGKLPKILHKKQRTS